MLSKLANCGIVERDLLRTYTIPMFGERAEEVFGPNGVREAMSDMERYILDNADLDGRQLVDGYIVLFDGES